MTDEDNSQGTDAAEAFEAMAFRGPRWWTVDDLLANADPVLPRRLREFLPDLAAGRLPDAPLDITHHESLEQF